MGRLSRTKGAGFERKVASAFRTAGFVDARRGLSQTRNGSEVPDVEGVPGFWIETKHRIRCNTQAALAQANASRAAARIYGDPKRPVAITKDNRAKPVATMLFTDFLVLLIQLRKAEARAVYLEAALKEALENSEKGAA